MSALNVEDLPEPVRAGERDHGVLAGEPQPRARALGDLGGLVHEPVVEAAPGDPDRLVEPVDAVGDVGAAAHQPLGALDQRGHFFSVPVCAAANLRSSTRRDI